MARKTSRTPAAFISAEQDLVTASLGSPQRQPRRQPRMHHSSNGSTPRVANDTSGSLGSCGSTAQIDKPDGGVDEANESEADEGDDENGDGDVPAPSDHANKECDDQAGHLIAEGEQQSAYGSRAISAANIPKHARFQLEQLAASRRKFRSPFCDSHDDDYNGVDEISGSDEDEPDVEKLEEKVIIESEEAGHISKVPASTPGKTSESSDEWEGFDIDDSLLMSDVPFFDEQYGRTDQGILDSQMNLFQNTSVFDEIDPSPSLPQSPPPSARRLHFQKPVLSPSDSSNDATVDDGLNGLFNLSVAPDEEVAAPPTFGGNDENDQGMNNEANSGGYLSGYESDFGDTTDEDDVPRPATTCPQSLLRQPSLISLGADIDLPRASQNTAPTTPTRNYPGPKLGSFKTNIKKSFAELDYTVEAFFIVPAEQPARVDENFNHVTSTRTSTANASPALPQATPTHTQNNVQVDFSNPVTADPVLALGSEYMTDGLLSIGLTPPSQPAYTASDSVFFPMDGMGDVNALYAADQDDETNESEDDLNIENFIDFGADSSDDEGNGLDMALPTPAPTSPIGLSDRCQSNAPPPNKTSPSGLMTSFDNDLIGAFRQGQNQHQHQIQRSQNGLAFNGHAFKSRRHPPANSLLSPPLKRKISGDFTSIGPLGSKKRFIQRLMPSTKD